MDNKKRKIVVSVIGLLGVLAIVSGVAVAWFSYAKLGTKENVITAGSVKFIYTEGTNALTMSDAMPMTDTQGQAQASDYFDFRVSSETASTMSIPYVVTVRVKDEASAANQLDPSVVKVWLSDQSDNELTNGLGIKYFQDAATPRQTGTFLNLYTDAAMNPEISAGVRKYNERVIYTGTVPAGSDNYNQLFRLRMWIDENTNFAPTDVTTPGYCTEDAGSTTVSTIPEVGDATEANCTATDGYTWHPPVTNQVYPYNNKTLTLIVNVYANGEVVSQKFTAEDVSYTPSAAAIAAGSTCKTLDCALDELSTMLGA